MKKIWIIVMTMCILLTGCGSKKQAKKADWKTDKYSGSVVKTKI